MTFVIHATDKDIVTKAAYNFNSGTLQLVGSSNISNTWPNSLTCNTPSCVSITLTKINVSNVDSSIFGSWFGINSQGKPEVITFSQQVNSNDTGYYTVNLGYHGY